VARHPVETLADMRGISTSQDLSLLVAIATALLVMTPITTNAPKICLSLMRHLRLPLRLYTFKQESVGPPGVEKLAHLSHRGELEDAASASVLLIGCSGNRDQR
jgi:hypothetical protein